MYLHPYFLASNFLGSPASAELMWFFCWLNEKAIHNGQVRIGQRDMARGTGIGRTRLRKLIKQLHELGIVETKSDPKRAHLKWNLVICNYKVINRDRYEKQTTISTQNQPTYTSNNYIQSKYIYNTTTGEPNAEPSIDLGIEQVEVSARSNCSDKLKKKSKKKPHLKDPFHATPLEVALGVSWLKFAKEQIPHARHTTWTEERFAKDLNKVKQYAKLTDDQMVELLDFIRGDDIWRPNAVSPASLMKTSRNGLKKIDNLLSSWRKKSKPAIPAVDWDFVFATPTSEN